MLPILTLTPNISPNPKNMNYCYRTLAVMVPKRINIKSIKIKNQYSNIVILTLVLVLMGPKKHGVGYFILLDRQNMSKKSKIIKHKYICRTNKIKIVQIINNYTKIL